MSVDAPAVLTGRTSARGRHQPTVPPLTAALLVATAALLPIRLGAGTPVVPADLFILLVHLSLLPRVARLPGRIRLPALLLLAALLLATGVTLLRGDPATATWALTRSAGFLLLVAYLTGFTWAFVRDRRLALRCLRWLVVSTATLNVLLLPSLPTRSVLVQAFPQKWDSRLSGALFDPNANGALLAACLVLVAFGPRDLWRRQWRRVALAVLLATCLAWTFSRGAAVGACAGLAYGGAEVLRRRPRVLLGVVLTVLVGVVLVATSPLPERIEARYESRPESSLTNRVDYVARSIGHFLDHPVTGAGLGTGTEEQGAVTHATVFWLLGDAGVVAAVAYLALFLGSIGAGRRAPPSGLRTGVVGALVAYAVVSLSFEALYQRPLWLLFALAHAQPARGARMSSGPATC